MRRMSRLSSSGTTASATPPAADMSVLLDDAVADEPPPIPIDSRLGVELAWWLLSRRQDITRDLIPIDLFFFRVFFSLGLLLERKKNSTKNRFSSSFFLYYLSFRLSLIQTVTFQSVLEKGYMSFKINYSFIKNKREVNKNKFQFIIKFYLKNNNKNR